MEFWDSNEASFNTLDLVTSSIHFFATYPEDGIFDISVSFCLVLMLHSTNQHFLEGNLLWKYKIKVKTTVLIR